LLIVQHQQSHRENHQHTDTATPTQSPTHRRATVCTASRSGLSALPFPLATAALSNFRPFEAAAAAVRAELNCSPDSWLSFPGSRFPSIRSIPSIRSAGKAPLAKLSRPSTRLESEAGESWQMQWIRLSLMEMIGKSSNGFM